MSLKRKQGELAVGDHPDAPFRLFLLKMLLDSIHQNGFPINDDTRARVLNEVRSTTWQGSWVSLCGINERRIIFTFRKDGGNTKRGNTKRFVGAFHYEDKMWFPRLLRFSRELQTKHSILTCEVRTPLDFEEFYRRLLRLEHFGPLIEADVIPPRDPCRRS